jgi:hypothetical protein
MNVSIALTAALYGATVVNHMEVKELIKDPATGKVSGVKVQDLLHQRRTGRLGRGEGVGEAQFVVKAKVILPQIHVGQVHKSNIFGWRASSMPLGLSQTAFGSSIKARVPRRL